MKKYSFITFCCLLALLVFCPGLKAAQVSEEETSQVSGDEELTPDDGEDLSSTEEEDKAATTQFKGNLLKITSTEDFQKGTADHVIIDENVGDGAVRLEESATEGSFVSEIYEGADFNTMVACWNAAIYDGGEVEVWARARHAGIWTEWLTWGPFSPFTDRGTTENKDCASAYVDQDTFCLKNDLTADAVQMKVQLRRDKAELTSPVVRMLSMTFKGGTMVPTYAETEVEELPEKMLIEAPAYSQKIRHPALKADICSPTALTVMMNSRNPELSLLPEELALNMKDEAEDIFGSWSFGVASAGLYGYQAYPQFCDQNILLQEMAKGHTVVVTVKYTNNPDSEDLPYLEGVIGETKGHLITLIGYEYEGGVRDDDHLYIYSSDSFCDSDQTAYRKYAWNQLKDCIKGTAYIIPDTEREVADPYVTGVTREALELVPVEGQDNTYMFMKDGEELDMTRFTSARGIFACTVDGVEVDMKKEMVDGPTSIRYEKAVQSPVNDVFFYNIHCNEDGHIILDRDEVFEKLNVEDQGQAITVYAISDRGYRYKGIIQ